MAEDKQDGIGGERALGGFRLARGRRDRPLCQPGLEGKDRVCLSFGERGESAKLWKETGHDPGAGQGTRGARRRWQRQRCWAVRSSSSTAATTR